MCERSESVSTHFYQFLENVEPEIAHTAKELERVIYTSPRNMLTHSRVFMEALLQKIFKKEAMEWDERGSSYDWIEQLHAGGYFKEKQLDAFHELRKLGNAAAHQDRAFRFSESLRAWEYLYELIKWYTEVYVSYRVQVPPYKDPLMQASNGYDMEELQVRLGRLEQLLQASVQATRPKDQQTPVISHKKKAQATLEEEPGMTVTRTLILEQYPVDIPHFLRDAFLLPQRFPQSIDYMKSLHQMQRARIMSELPSKLDYLHEGVARRTIEHSRIFVEDLIEFIKEETRRKALMDSRPGEFFIFYKGDEIAVTPELGETEITIERFPGSPMLISQLHRDGMVKVNQLPKELIILGKYHSVGVKRLDTFFEQLKEVQQHIMQDA